MLLPTKYITPVTVSALATTLFLGGWHAPFGLHAIWSGCNSGWFPMIWFTLKVILGIFVFVWLRGTLPRLRYDQFMSFGWKVLIPINLVWILAVTAIHVLRDRNFPAWEATAIPLAIVLLVVVVPGLMIWEGTRAKREAELAEDEEDEAQEALTFPIPPMDLRVPTPPRQLATASVRRPVGELSGGTDEEDSDG
jgi:NADH-quinone oxidoreductase subunit H